MKAEALLQRRLGEAGLGIQPAQDIKRVKYEAYLSRLKAVSEGGEVGPDPMADPAVRHG